MLGSYDGKMKQKAHTAAAGEHLAVRTELNAMHRAMVALQHLTFFALQRSVNAYPLIA